MELVGNVKTYDWGKLGGESFVAKLATANDPNFRADPNQPYAELWMGDHCSGPSYIRGSGEELGKLLSQDLVGNIGPSRDRLSYLFKVLSIRKALSIQVHPDKAEAEKLHAQFPDIYKDPNHKPELAIALTEFHAMCGFRPYEEIYQLVSGWPQLVQLLGEDKIRQLKSGGEDSLKELYSNLMHSKHEQLEQCISSMVGDIRSKSDRSSLDDLFLQLYKDFSTDVGLLSIYFLNVLQLKPGQAIYLPANVPHAYLSGDCIECMACSDNVVRAGLTPKFKDVDTLLRLLSYEGSPADSKIYQPVQLDGQNQPYTRTFIPSVLDFAVAELKIPPGSCSEYVIGNRPSGCILLICSGKGQLVCSGGQQIELNYGKIVFVPAKYGVNLKLVLKDASSEFVAYQAMSNDF
ncbi:mannose-6-phosphate isomerase [Uranotaenia lowii]|uniref:mannose-6-phosphate isomerase n=1 Tax=Uranotaenia lowii TaxID=190385 RepID=UPI00247B1AC0|nr:mannose-6-phosphate isomerase [Uranotaenia lowii]XP_055612434.1 mannose-6-phosphate isomerase [Uranotaenia lowii]